MRSKSFSFEARTLLELGKELISTDEVALYELIKNGVDAGSPKVEIDVRSRLAYTDYREALRQLRESGKALSGSDGVHSRQDGRGRQRLV